MLGEIRTNAGEIFRELPQSFGQTFIARCIDRLHSRKKTVAESQEQLEDAAGAADLQIRRRVPGMRQQAFDRQPGSPETAVQRKQDIGEFRLRVVGDTAVFAASGQIVEVDPATFV